MIKRIIEAPFVLLGWLFKNTYGRVVSVFLVTLLACAVNYPIQDTEIGEWVVVDTLGEKFSAGRGKAEGRAAALADVDATGRIDRDSIEHRDSIGRVALHNRWAWLTMPFHHVVERELEVVSEGWNESRTNWVKKRRILRISRGLTLGLDLQGGTELTYKIVAPEGAEEEVAGGAQDMAQVIRERINTQGLKEPRVQPVGDDRILVQVPGVGASEVERVKSTITRIGRLEFRLVADPEDDATALKEAETTGEAPPGWHWYNLEQENTETGKLETEKLLISDKIELTGDSIERVTVGYGGAAQSEIAVLLRFRDSDAFWRVTRNNVGKRLAIVLDDVRDKEDNLVKAGEVHSAPVIRQPILGAAEITGGFTQKTAEDLKLVLQSGSLKWPLKPESEQFVGPYQGLKSIQDGRKAIIIGFGTIIVFIFVYYMKLGLVADFALLLNLLILLAALALRNATLTLPGIAGIMLTIGMSIDANVLIFERIREEVKKMADKPLVKSMRDGHRKALVTIFDANLTTLITGIILHEFGTGPVKGFAVTLCYGIVISMFTAIVVTRVILEAMLRARLMTKLSMLEIVRRPHLPFVALRKASLSVSVVLVVGGLVYFLGGPGERLGIEFSSGTLVGVNLNQRVNADVVRAKLREAGYPNAEVQQVASVRGAVGSVGSSKFNIRLRYVPLVNVKKAGRVDGVKYPDFAGGAEVVVEVGRKADTNEMARRLQEAGSPGCLMEPGPKHSGLFSYTVRNDDHSPDAVRDLESNVRSVFGSQLITDDIRQAFGGPGGESLLAEQGVQKLSETSDRLTVRISLERPVELAQVKEPLVSRLGPEVEVKPEGELRQDKADVFHVTAPSGSLAKIKDTLRIRGLATLEPFAGITKIYPSVARELTTKAVVAFALSLLAIIAYIWFRFEFRFGLAAVVAVMHDVIITLGALALTGREISLTVIAALLTIIGSSLNATIVVFDRIRENRKTVRKTRFPEIVNLSINQTLNRTLLTSLTTLLAVVSLFVFGGAAIEDFAFTLLVGVIVGTYSSIFIASPILLMTGEQGALRGPLGAPSSRTARPLEGFRTS